METVTQRQAAIRSPVVAYALKTMLFLFGVMVVLSYAYTLFVSLMMDKLHVSRMIMQAIVMVVPFVLGWLIDKKHPGHTIALLFLLMAYSLAVSTIALGLRYFSESHFIPYADSIQTITLVLDHIMWLPGVYRPCFSCRYTSQAGSCSHHAGERWLF